MKHTITQLVKGTIARLSHASSGKLFYTITVEDTEYQFPIDITDRAEVGDAQFNLEEKGIYLMRYIKKAIKSEEIRWQTVG
jgi:hypothetical protein